MQNDNKMIDISKKIVNKIIDLALEQHYSDRNISKKCENHKLLILSYNKIDNEAFQTVINLVHHIQEKFFDTYSLLSTSLKTNFNKDFTRKNVSYPIKAFFMYNENIEKNCINLINQHKDLEISFKPNIKEVKEIKKITFCELKNYVWFIQNQKTSEEELFLFYISLDDFFEKFETFDYDLSNFFILFDAKHLNNVITEIQNFAIYENEPCLFQSKRLKYSFLPLYEIHVTNFDINYYKNLKYKGNENEISDYIFNRLQNNCIEIKNIAFSMKIPQTKTKISSRKSVNEKILNSYSIKLTIDKKNYELIINSKVEKDTKNLQSDLFFEKIVTTIHLKSNDLVKIFATCFCIIIKNEFDENIATEKFKQQFNESLASQNIMFTKICEIFDIFKSKQFDVEKDLAVFERLCGFNKSLNRISFKHSSCSYGKSFEKNFYSSFVNSIYNSLYQDFKMTFYKYQASEHFFFNFKKSNNIVGTETHTIKMQEISKTEAANFQESFNDKLLLVFESETYRPDTFNYFFLTYYFNLPYGMLEKAIEFHKKNNERIFEDFYTEYLYFFDEFPYLIRQRVKDFFQETFKNLSEYELKAIFLDEIKYEPNQTFKKLFFLRTILYFEINLKNSKDIKQLDLINEFIITLQNTFERKIYLAKIEIEKLKLSLMQTSAKIFFPILLNLFDFSRIKFFETLEHSDQPYQQLFRLYKIIEMKKQCFND
ncbi:hypothetical protein GVAV_003035 [Gurleya vavrai]